MRLITHLDDTAPRKQRYRVLRQTQEDPNGSELGGSWLTLQSFPTEREANAFASGFWQGHIAAVGITATVEA